jgi:prepilin-type N-terminal cleavage/methylation domain-containing protein
MRQRKLENRSNPQPAGFTLVEMLVAVALVLLMMSLFAQVFQMAGESISKQRGLAENDQRSRTLQTILKADIDKRSYRWVYPFAANEDVSAPESYIGKRQGFFYISENNPNNDIDDVLHFTVMSTMLARNKDRSPYYGRALNLTGFNVTLNQPDADDAMASVNNTGLSTVAEIVYFVRNGNLYRRQLLVREPLPTFSTKSQPTNTNNNADLFDPNSATPMYSTTGPFWNDFDYTAYMYINPAFPGVPFAQFPGTDSLDNSGSIASVALAKPQYRFGFSPMNIPGVTGGRPKEYADSSTTASFIGRFTMQETSDTDFRYPQNTTAGGNVPTNPTLAMTLDPLDSSIIGPDDLSGGSRRGEDLLLTNVHSFDIKVWDELAQNFVDIGDPSLTVAGADYALGNRYATGIAIGTAPNPSYGPRVNEDSSINAINTVFDTWHPLVNLDTSNDPSPSPSTTTGQSIADEPPYRPTYYRPASISGGSPFDRPSWRPGVSYNIGDVVFPSGPPKVDQAFASPPFTSPHLGRLPYGAPFYYRCISAPAMGGSTSTTNEPVWPKADSLTVVDNNLVWQAVENRKPLRAVKFEVRFIDPSTQQMRQASMIMSLVD